MSKEIKYVKYGEDLRVDRREGEERVKESCRAFHTKRERITGFL